MVGKNAVSFSIGEKLKLYLENKPINSVKKSEGEGEQPEPDAELIALK